MLDIANENTSKFRIGLAAPTVLVDSIVYAPESIVLIVRC